METIDIFGRTNDINLNNPMSCLATNILEQQNIRAIRIYYTKYNGAFGNVYYSFEGEVVFSKNNTELKQEFKGKNLADVAKQIQDFCMAL